MYRNQGRPELCPSSLMSRSDWVRTALGHGISWETNTIWAVPGPGGRREDVFVYVCLDYHPICDWCFFIK